MVEFDLELPRERNVVWLPRVPINSLGRNLKLTPNSVAAVLYGADANEEQQEARIWVRYQKRTMDVLAHTGSMAQASCVRATQQGHADPSWFTKWAKKELPDLVAQGNIRAQIELEKRENTWPARLRRGAAWLIGGVILTIVGVLVMWVMVLIGFK